MNEPPINADTRRSDELTEKILGAVFEVSNVLGTGFLERVYERALLRELSLRGLRAKTQVRFTVFYKGQAIGEYAADSLVEDEIVLELKCVDRFSNENIAQCLNYLKVSKCKVALLINFQRTKVEWKRIVHGFGSLSSSA
jgi:GxxExxY protein